jgi:hypothetical protein
MAIDPLAGASFAGRWERITIRAISFAGVVE